MALFTGLSSHRRQRLRYCWCRAEALGPTRIELAAAAALDEFLTALHQLPRGRWRERGELGVMADPRMRAFHRLAAPGLLEQGLLRLYGLRVGERLVAVFHTMAARPRLYVYLSGFDPALPQISPGLLVLAHLIQHAAGDSVLTLHAWPPDAILLAPVSNCSGASSPGSWRMRQDAGQYGACSGFERCSMTKQLLHLVFGGELMDPTSTEFADLKGLDLVGIYPNYEEAYKAWRGKAQTTIDNAHMRYFVVHLHRLLDPASEPPRSGGSE